MKKLFVLFVVACTLFACKKEKQIEKNLWKESGEWNIDYFENKVTNADTVTQHIQLSNAGTIKFMKDGTGTIKMGETEEAFSYTVSDETITINQSSFPFPMNYDATWKKNKLTLDYKQSLSIGSVSNSIIQKWDLTKK